MWSLLFAVVRAAVVFVTLLVVVCRWCGVAGCYCCRWAWLLVAVVKCCVIVCVLVCCVLLILLNVNVCCWCCVVFAV